MPLTFEQAGLMGFTNDPRTEAGLREAAEAVMEGVQKAWNHIGEFTPTAFVMCDQGIAVVPFRSYTMTDLSRDAWLREIRKAASETSAYAAATIFKGRFRWSDPAHRDRVFNVVIVLMDTQKFGYLPFVAEVGEDNKLGPVRSFAELARETTGLQLGNVKGMTGRYGRLLPLHWMN